MHLGMYEHTHITYTHISIHAYTYIHVHIHSTLPIMKKNMQRFSFIIAEFSLKETSL